MCFLQAESHISQKSLPHPFHCLLRPVQDLPPPVPLLAPPPPFPPLCLLERPLKES